MRARVCGGSFEGKRVTVKVGLVLGAGGVLGGAWLVGGLSAVARETDWDPGSADFVVGTSAGSMIGALVAGGIRPGSWWPTRAERSSRASWALTAALPPKRIAPPARASGSTAASLQSAPGRSAWRSPPCRIHSGTRRSRWSPGGSRPVFISTDSLRDTVARAVPGDWVDHPNYWAVACDYDTGRRTPFGRLGSPRAHIGDAVAASCAIPGFYRPVKIGRRRYVDGGVCSVSNLDLVAGRGLDLVICLNPLTSSQEGGRAGGGVRAAATGAISGAIDFIPSLTRRASRARLEREERKVRRFGTQVVLIEPTAEDHAAMGRNWMNTERRQDVIDTAEETVAAQLRRPEVRALLEGMPKGEPHRVSRPPGHPSTWPELLTSSTRRAA